MRKAWSYYPEEMSPEKIISCRKQLERKYTNVCLHLEIPLNRTMDGRVIGVSPTSLYHHCGLNSDGEDTKLFRKLNKAAHFGERARIEREVIKLVATHITKRLHSYHFFELKHWVFSWVDTYNKVTVEARRNELPIISKDKYFRMMKLLRRWGEISKEQHYKVTAAQRRISKKLELIREQEDED